MSRKICVQFEIRNMLIMKDTLKQMGVDYEELSQNHIRAGKYEGIDIDSSKGTINYDSSSEGQVNSIKQNYMVNFYRDKAIREGMQLKEERTASGEIRLHVTHS